MQSTVSATKSGCSKVTGDRLAESTHHGKAPEKRSAPVYAACRKPLNTHRSKTPVGSHMHPAYSISGALPVHEALPLCPSQALSGLLRADERVDSCAGPGDAEGVAAFSALAIALLDHRTAGAVGAMGCPG